MRQVMNSEQLIDGQCFTLTVGCSNSAEAEDFGDERISSSTLTCAVPFQPDDAIKHETRFRLLAPFLLLKP